MARKPRQEHCTITGCPDKHYAGALCRSHYDMKRRRGTTEPRQPRPKRTCSVDGCITIEHSKGLCQKHYRKQQRWGSPEGPSPAQRKRPGPQPDPSKERSRHRADNPTRRRLTSRSKTSKASPIPPRSFATETHCANGHAFTPENTYVYPDTATSAGKRVCKICRRNAQEKFMGKPVSGDRPVGTWNRNKTHCPQGHAYAEHGGTIKATGARYCRACRSISTKTYEYGISKQDYLALIEASNGQCQICGNEFKGARDRHVDHFHDDGRIRGLLCGSCNNGLGRFRDTPALLLAAAQYLLDADAFRVSSH